MLVFGVMKFHLNGNGNYRVIGSQTMCAMYPLINFEGSYQCLSEDYDILADALGDDFIINDAIGILIPGSKTSEILMRLNSGG